MLARLSRVIEPMAGEVSGKSGKSRLTACRGVLCRAFAQPYMGYYNHRLYCYSGTWYKPVQDGMLEELVRRLSLRMGVELTLCQKHELADACRAQLRLRELSVNRSLMSFSNGVLDVGSGAFVQGGPECGVFSGVDYAYSDDERSLEWTLFVAELFPDASLRGIVQEFLGAALLPREESGLSQMLVLHGGDSGGVEVFMRVVCGLFPPEDVSYYSLYDLVGSTERKRKNIAQANGRRLNYITDFMGLTSELYDADLRAVISGEPMEGLSSRGERVCCRDLPPMVMNARELPRVNALSYGMCRRMLVVPVNKKVKHQHRLVRYAKALLEERAAVFAWLVEGLRRYKSNHFKFSGFPSVVELMDAYQASGSTALKFMHDSGYYKDPQNMVEEQPVWMQVQRLYKGYKQWCARTVNAPMPAHAFCGELVSFGYSKSVSGAQTDIAVYGERAVKSQVRALSVARALNEYRDLLEQFRREGVDVTEVTIREHAAWLMEQNRWSRVAVGFSELGDYIGFSVDWASHLMRGTLDGCYEVDHGIYYFNLDAVDAVWRPRFERRNAGADYDVLVNKKIKENGE